MNMQYYWNKLIKKLPGSSIKNTSIPKNSKIEARSTVINSNFGQYSYAGYGCTILNCNIGNFCSIADSVLIGLGKDHPVHWVSTSPAFYYGRDSIPKDLACKEYKHEIEETNIGNDVWIGSRAIIKAGITIGNGAIVGMGSIVTKDVPPYAIVAGVPARVIGYRFDENIQKELLKTEWWNLSRPQIKDCSQFIDNVEAFIENIQRLE